MYNMYPDYSEAPQERGAGGLGHYDYPVYEKPDQTTAEAPQTPEEVVVPSPTVGRGAGYVSVKQMVAE